MHFSYWSVRRVLSFVGGVILVALLQGEAQAAATFQARARLLVSATQIEVPELNSLLQSLGFQSANVLPSVGVEITQPMGKWFEAGLRYQLRFLTRGIQGLATNDQSALAALRQDSIQAVARVSVLKRKFLRADLVAGFGGNNTRFELRNTNQDGELSRTDLGDFVATPVASVGASLGFGVKKIYVTTEVGFERNRIPDLLKTGAITSSISTIDISGPYAMVALMFDGVTASSR